MKKVDIYQKIRQKRQEVGLSQQAFAERTGLARPNIARLESGHTNATVATIQECSDALGLELKLEDARDWMDGITFIGLDNHIAGTWKKMNSEWVVSFDYRKQTHLIPAPEVMGKKEKLMYYNVMAEWAIDEFLESQELERLMEEASESLFTHA
ncbi:MAG: helix-turn-helix transcriptional regulator [Lachnospiraceae bacterium]|nr:helix-turn-helix transcriptional regulator [Lachnospiraceae bacterium]